MSTPVEAKQGLLIEEATTCKQPCRHVEVPAVDLRLATGSRAAETLAEMAPMEIFRPSVREVYASINSMAIMENTASSRTVHRLDGPACCASQPIGT
jgi:hypothetical protein